MSVNLTKAIEAAAADSCRNIFKGRCGTHGFPVRKGKGFCQIGLNMAGAAVIAGAPALERAVRGRIAAKIEEDVASRLARGVPYWDGYAAREVLYWDGYAAGMNTAARIARGDGQ